MSLDDAHSSTRVLRGGKLAKGAAFLRVFEAGGPLAFCEQKSARIW